jgi:hypothetical protein
VNVATGLEKVDNPLFGLNLCLKGLIRELRKRGKEGKRKGRD